VPEERRADEQAQVRPVAVTMVKPVAVVELVDGVKPVAVMEPLGVELVSGVQSARVVELGGLQVVPVVHLGSVPDEVRAGGEAAAMAPVCPRGLAGHGSRDQEDCKHQFEQAHDRLPPAR
jgi:hypothetical protein